MMSQFPRELKVDLSGQDVASLQEGLTRIGLPVSPDEQQRSLFGPSTRDAVARFQEQRNLPATGVVDAATAGALEHAVGGIGPGRGVGDGGGRPGGDGPPPGGGGAFNVSGRVFSPNRAGLAGLQVQIVDKNVGPDVPLAASATDSDGKYSVAFGGEQFRGQGKIAPDIQARVFHGPTFLAASDVRYNAS